MTRLALLSDLHLEFKWPSYGLIPDTWQQLHDKINSADADLVINAGDIDPYPDVRESFHKGIHVPYIHILGNHDFYGLQHPAKSRFIRDVNGLKVVGATLWTDFDKANPLTMFRFKECLADGTEIIPTPPYTRVAYELLDIFKSDLEFIDKEYADVVVTHHAPSMKSVNTKYINSGFLNYYFMSDLDRFIKSQSNTKLWLHGHMHDPCDYHIGHCRVVANPLGYPGETYKSIADYNLKIVEV